MQPHRWRKRIYEMRGVFDTYSPFYRVFVGSMELAELVGYFIANSHQQ